MRRWVRFPISSGPVFSETEWPDDPLQNAAELVAYSLKTEVQRVLDRELIFISRETDPAPIYMHIENAHGLLRNCCQSGILTLIQAIDKGFDATVLFPVQGGESFCRPKSCARTCGICGNG